LTASQRCWSSGASDASRAARICSRDHLVLLNGLVTVFSPVGLDEDAIDLLEVHDTGLVADGFDERAQTEVVEMRAEAKQLYPANPVILSEGSR
jgi:hypothetical protein